MTRTDHVARAISLPLDEMNVGDPELYQQDAWRPYFARLRREAPVNYCKQSLYGPYWSVSTHELISKVELAPQIYSNRADLGGIQLNDIAKGLDRPAFVSMDPPEHTPRRRAVAPIANRSGLRAYDDLIRERTSAVLDALPKGEVFDWVRRVSMELTAMMLATMFDFPQARRGELMYWSDVATANLNAPNPLVKSEEERYQILEQMADAFIPLWRERTQGRGGFDLITMLANDPSTAEMDRAELIGTLFLLIVGGNDTTRNSMSGGLLALERNPDQLEIVRGNRELIPNMVSEMIRWQTPVIHMRRTALEDTELAGQKIAKGDKVVLWYVSGNVDESYFEEPDNFLVERGNARRHLAFGAGIHRCVGDRLAELQLRILWEELLERDWRISLVEPPARLYSNFIRGFSSMPVRIET